MANVCGQNCSNGRWLFLCSAICNDLLFQQNRLTVLTDQEESPVSFSASVEQKDPRARQIRDLTQDIQDGELLFDLMEVLLGHNLVRNAIIWFELSKQQGSR